MTGYARAFRLAACVAVALALPVAVGCSCPLRACDTAGVCPVGAAPMVGRVAPDFEARAVMGDDTVAVLTRSDLAGDYAVLFFYPADFTYVCPTEAIAFDERLEEFTEIGCRVVGVSVDPPETHLAWKARPRDSGGVGALRYPLVSDAGGRIARAYGVMGPDGRALRAWFLLGPDGVVRHLLVNEPALGRSVNEALRLAAAARTIDEIGRLCPVEWQPGDEMVGPGAPDRGEGL